MKKRILSFALSLVLVLSLVPAAVAVQLEDYTFTIDGVGTFLTTVVTPHDYLGEVSIGGLWFRDEPVEQTFSVFVIEDGGSFKTQVYSIERDQEFYAYFTISWLGLSDGKAQFDYAYLDLPPWWIMVTEESPLYFSNISDSNGRFDGKTWCPLLEVADIYNNSGPLDQICSTSVVFTESQVAEFKATGELPPLDYSGNEDPTSLLDLSELKALLTDAEISPTPTPAPQPVTVNPTASTVYVNGESKAFEAYLIGGNNFFKLRDLALVLDGSEKQFEVEWDAENNAIKLTSGEAYTSVGGEMTQGDGKSKTTTPTASKVYLDGRELNLTAYNIGGNNFFQLREIMSEIDVYVGYDNATKNITLDTSKGYVVP